MSARWRPLAAMFILITVFCAVGLLVLHGYTLQAAISGVGAAGAVAIGITKQVLGTSRPKPENDAPAEDAD